MNNAHIPVLAEEAIELLNPQSNENFIDATLGGGGHAKIILEKISPNGKLLGIEFDEDTLKIAEENLKLFEGRIIFVNENFTNVKKIAIENKLYEVNGIIFDLGVSSFSFENSGRGFSFLKDEPLLMTFDKKSDFGARDIVNGWSGGEIEKILKEYGEERFAARISKNIVVARKNKKIATTFELVEIIKTSVPGFYRRNRIHFATKTFQALRIAVNNEFENIKKGIIGGIDILSNGGRIAVISFHSLEDRIVKYFFKDLEKSGKIKILTKKPVTPTKEEIRINPKSRSAKLRAAVKI